MSVECEVCYKTLYHVATDVIIPTNLLYSFPQP